MFMLLQTNRSQLKKQHYIDNLHLGTNIIILISTKNFALFKVNGLLFFILKNEYSFNPVISYSLILRLTIHLHIGQLSLCH